MIEYKAKFDLNSCEKWPNCWLSNSEVIDMFLKDARSRVHYKDRAPETVFHKVGDFHDKMPAEFHLFARTDQSEIAEINLDFLIPELLNWVKPYRKIDSDTYKLEEHIHVGENIVAWKNNPVYRINIGENANSSINPVTIQPYRGPEIIKRIPNMENRLVDISVSVPSWTNSKCVEFRNTWYNLLKHYEEAGAKRLE